MVIDERRIRGQYSDRKQHCGGTRYFDCEIYRNFIESHIAINIKNGGNNIEITMPVSELMEFLKEAEQ